MSLYEGMFLVDNRQANRDWDGTLEKVKGFITKHGGEIVRCDKWGERKLAYDISIHRRGTYVLAHFNASGSAVTEIYRECELAEMIVRALIVKVDAIPPEEALHAPAEGSLRRLRQRGAYEGDGEEGGRRRPPRGAPAAEEEAPAEAEPAEESSKENQ